MGNWCHDDSHLFVFHKNFGDAHPIETPNLRRPGGPGWSRWPLVAQASLRKVPKRRDEAFATLGFFLWRHAGLLVPSRMKKPFKAAFWERSFGMRTDLRFDEKRTFYLPRCQMHSSAVSKNRIVEENYEQLRKIHLKNPQLCPWASAMRVFFKADFFPAAGEEGTLLMAGKMPGFKLLLSTRVCLKMGYTPNEIAI